MSPARPVHCQAVPASLPGCAQLPAKLFPASCQALPSSLPSFVELTAELCPDLHQAHCQALPSSPQRGPKTQLQSPHHICWFFHCRLSTVKRFSRIGSCNLDSNLCPAPGETTAWDKHPKSFIRCCCVTVGVFLPDLRLRPVLGVVRQVPMDPPQQQLLLPVVLLGV